jgi:hypothetical protein
MATVTEGQIEKLLEDVASIKTVINRNKPLLQHALMPAHFRFISLLAGGSIIAISLLVYFLMGHFGGFGEIPRWIRYLIYGGIAADVIVIQILKRLSFLKSLRTVDRKYTLSHLLKDFFSYRILHIYIPLVSGMLFMVIYLIYHDRSYYIVPVLALGLSLWYNFIGSLTEIRQYLFTGYWFLVTGFGSLLFDDIPALIALSASLGLGLVIFGFVGASLSAPEVEE